MQPYPAYPAKRTFLYVEAIVAVPAFLFVGPLVAVAMFQTKTYVLGSFVSVFVLAILWFGLRAYYVASVYPDGTLTFRGLTRSVRSNVRDVSRIGISTSGRASSWVFYFHGDKAQFGMLQGRGLGQLIVAMNPGVQYPQQLYPRRLFGRR